MECFNIQYYLSQYHSQSLPPQTLGDFESHIKKCTSCSSNIKRTQEIAHLIAQTPFAKLDINALKKRSIKLSDLKPKDLFRYTKQWWAQLSPLIRLLAEAGLIAFIITVGIRLGPQLKKIYETRMDYQLKALIAEGENTDSPSLQRGKLDIDSTYDSEFSDVAEEESDTTALAKTSKAEVWRFNIKTDNPAAFRNQVIRFLSRDLRLGKETANIGGIEAPGGIQFDIVIESKHIPTLKSKLEELSQNSQNTDSTYGQLFTWYKSRTKKPLPVDHARIVIWLSQI